LRLSLSHANLPHKKKKKKPRKPRVTLSGAGAVKKGILGGITGGLLFQYPGALMMAIFGYGAASFLSTESRATHAVVDGARNTAV
jgi:hypothetical protein